MSIFRDSELSFSGENVLTNIKRIEYFEASVNSGAIAATSAADVSVTRNGVSVGDAIIIVRAPAEEARVTPQGCRVTGANTFVVRFTNQSAAAATGGADTYGFLWFDLT